MASEGEYDVIVIGAGLAGLTAAYHLTKTKPNFKVLVLEAKDRVGGRTQTVPLKGAKGTDYWDVGGQWVCKTQHHVLWLLNELGMEQYPQYCTGTKLQLSGKRSKVKTYEGDVPSLPLHVLLDLLNFETKADRLAREIPCDAPWKAQKADDYDSITFEQYIARETWTQGAKEVVESSFDVVIGSCSRGHSALNYLFYINSAINTRSLYDNKNAGAQESKIKGGVQAISNKLRDQLGHSNVLLSEPVVSIDQGSTSEVKVQTLSGKSFTCKYVINAIPMNCAVAIQYLPEPPARRNMFIGHTKVGNLIKFIVTYQTTFWREKGYSGEILNFTNQSPDDGDDYSGPVQYVSDATTADGNPALVGFINNTMYWGDVEESKRKDAILKHLATFLGSEALTPLDFIVKDWSKEWYNGGCPVNMMMTGAAKYWDEIRNPFHRVHWAGTETATHWMGYLSGAVQSGLRAAEEVSSRLTGPGVSSSNSSDLLKTLDERGNVERRSEDGWGLSLMSKVGLALVVVGLLASTARVVIQRK